MDVRESERMTVIPADSHIGLCKVSGYAVGAELKLLGVSRM